MSTDDERAEMRSTDGDDVPGDAQRSPPDEPDSPVDGAHDSPADGGYVHRPHGDGTAQADDVDEEFGWRGWVVFAVVVVSFLVVPPVIIYRPPALPYWVALLAFPMLPAVLLGLVAVWGTTRS